MFSQDQMQELVTYEENGGGVISVYLDTDSTRQSVEACTHLAQGGRGSGRCTSSARPTG